MKRLSIVIATWNSCDDLRRCLRSIRDYRAPWPIEVIVVENASTDGTAEMVAQEFPECVLIRNEKNEGIVARNQGISRASGECILLLDADTVLLPGALENMVRVFETNKDVAMVGPRLIGSDDEVQYSCRRFPTVLTFMLNGLKWNTVRRQRYLMQEVDHEKTFPVDWIIGACQMVRKEAFEKAGLLDPRYFFYYEDVEFCYRVRQSGYSIWFCGEAVVRHAYQRRSTKSVVNKYLFYHFWNASRFFLNRRLGK